MADAVGAAFWSFRPGQKAVVFYDDDSVWHERRILLRGGSPGHYWIATPDADVYEEDLRGQAEDGPRRVRLVPFGIRTLANLRTAVYRFREEWTHEQMKKLVKEAIAMHVAAYGNDPGADESEVELADGSSQSFGSFIGARQSRRLTGKGPLHRKPDNGWTPPTTRPGAWRVADPRGHLDVGMRLDPGGTMDVRLGEGEGVLWKDPLWIRVEWVEDDSLPAWKASRVKELQTVVSVNEGGDLALDLGLPAPPGPSTPLPDAENDLKETKGGGDGEDVRTLWVLYDEQNERYRPWRQVVQDSSAHSFKDWPHQGPQTALHTLKHFLRHGGEPKAWMELF